MATLTKARPAGAREAEQPSVALPEKLYPAKAKLDKVLADHVKASLDIEEARGHLARSETDEQSVLNNPELSDAECSDRVAVAQRNRGIYGARVANREATLGKQAAELSKAINEAAGELRSLVGAEITRREDIIRERVIQALQVGNAVDPRRMAPELGSLLRFSEPVQVIRALAPSPVIPTPGNSPEAWVYTAKAILSKFEALVAEEKKTI